MYRMILRVGGRVGVNLSLFSVWDGGRREGRD